MATERSLTVMGNKQRRVLTLVLTAFFLQSCATNSEKTDFSSNFEKESNKTQQESEVEEDKNTITPSTALSSVEPLGINRDISGQSSSELLNLSDEQEIAVTFENIELKEFINHALANILKVDFIIDPKADMQGKTVTLSVKEKLSQRRFLSLFKDILDQNQLALKVQNDMVFIYANSERRGLPEYDYGYGRSKESVPVGSQPILQIIPIDFIDPKSLASFLIRLSNASPEQLGDPNIIGIRGNRNDVLRAIDIINLLDVPNVRGQMIQFIKLEYIPSSEFILKVTELLENEGVNVSTVLRFTDLSRQNGVIAHSNNEKMLQRVAYWQKQLDTPESTDDKQYFMYYPENMEAAKLAGVLQKLVSVTGESASGGTSNTNSLPSANTNISNTSADKDKNSAGYTKDFSYVTDENRNVIIIYATASKYKSILPLLKKLDVTPPQVLIEARLIEITLTDSFSHGIDWSLYGGSAVRNRSDSRVANVLNGVFSYTISGADYNLGLTLKANQDRIKVLSSPRIVVANGESASINVGQDIPVLSTQSADVDTDRVLQSIQYRSTGVDLTVKPTVNSSNVISLELTQNVSETQENDSSGLDSPIVLNRSFKTSVIAHSGQSLVLGGLIRENNSNKDGKVPLLGDLPLLGNLFSNKSDSKSRTELVVLITPRVISNSSDIDEIKNAFLDELTLFN